ncbi:hypothetical protein SAMN02745225_01576 [Ferrithrix thermotolerans DSM 19514]|jgi:hypothetical protein|uniref:Uncharacterized protein n=1 Tax=Ferrithrix thermotolerans DSM 19514 TaxID=1121881 RepID=A0A1M4W712_9ACTN|nr:hypothetical protein [Ferrithrix thermotolerans]SHE76989.1 hypothetical protein SAMN02745225_01576 [Ferrithrix thermotolerans DSM 19514]
MEISIGKRVPVASSLEMAEAIEKYLEQGKASEITLFTTQNEVKASWCLGPTISELFDVLPSKQKWLIRGHCELVGGFTLQDGRHKYELSLTRPYSVYELALGVVRYRNAYNRPINADKEIELRDLFQILESPANGSSYRLAELMAEDLVSSLHRTDLSTNTKSEVETVAELFRRMDEVGYDRLWTAAFSRLT